MTSKQLGQVPSLFPHIKKEWWKDAYKELYLWTDGDCVEDPTLTEAESAALLQIPTVQKLFSSPPPPSGSSIKVLDLCCGQGRHSIHLAKQFPTVHFHGIDQSVYLLGLAKQRAEKAGVTGNTKFEAGDARCLSFPAREYDLVMLMGNSFGHGSRDDDLNLLCEAHRVLKPGGVLVIDYVDGDWMRENATASGWEWLGKDHFIPGQDGKPVLALRERELSPDGNCLASREIVLDLAGGSDAVLQDLFYAVQLYGMNEMQYLLSRAGLRVLESEGKQISAPVPDGQNQGAAQDMGMMEHRQLVVAQKPDSSLSGLDLQDEDTYIHPHVSQSRDKIKGRLLRATGPIQAGAVVIADAPYALVPTVPPDRNDALLCSNLLCRRRVPLGHGERCPNSCVQDIIWCNAHCQAADQARHDYECAWLKHHAAEIRQEHSEEDFAMLWIIIRMLAGWHLELELNANKDTPEQTHLQWSDRFNRGWSAIEAMLGSQDIWPAHTVQRWRGLVDKYLCVQDPLFPFQSGVDTDFIVTLICKEESNTFGLYNAVTGPRETQPERGLSYGLGCYPRATMANHSCDPNLQHGPDGRGRMVMTATRDIAAGEECFIAYFDMTVHSSLEARRRRTRDLFNFTCDCARCLREAEGAAELKA
ncbi:uncharacterized protein DSM5745_04144 [Aspergillus mulundensis]|uniref:SET domain-containing protein n=1 Tax=Aspergillus mulundensis TaxID=1810919 RepID=A0A3D8SDI0_9EURO|nr:Uncharacterized protein DSM5745_04144 [Aspergillus mulundensis]RDW83818.1 Uncharacterized protein DSM5745_04144 [Aspergillus mulundensis]